MVIRGDGFAILTSDEVMSAVNGYPADEIQNVKNLATYDDGVEVEGDTFYFNPDASEFVPSLSSACCPVDSTTVGDTFHGEDVEEYVEQNFAPVANSFVSSGAFETVIPSYTPDSASNTPAMLPSSHHYFPEPPKSFYQSQPVESIDNQPLNFYGEGSNSSVKEFDATQNNATLQPQSFTPLVPVNCYPLYGFIGYSYAMPGTTTTDDNQMHHKISAGSTSCSTGTPQVSHQSVFVPMSRPQFSQPVQQLLQSSQLQQPVPIMHQVPPRVANPNSQLQSRPSTPRPGSCVTVFVPNISGNGNYPNQKSFPSLIPAILPQNFRWVQPN